MSESYKKSGGSIKYAGIGQVDFHQSYVQVSDFLGVKDSGKVRKFLKSYVKYS